MSTPNTIVLKGNGIRKEAEAAGTITPGDLVELTSAGKVQRKSSAATTAQRAFAVENEVVGKGIDHDYAAGDNVLYEVLPPGAEVYALVPASAAAIVIGDRLESAGSGKLRKVASSADTDDTERQSVVAIALEAVDNSAGTDPARIKVELL